MDKIFLAISSLFIGIGGKALDIGKDIVKAVFEFISRNGKFLVRWAFFIIVINLSFTLLSFFIYSFYYGAAYVLSHFVTMTTFNIIHMGFLAMIIYFIYKFLYKN